MSPVVTAVSSNPEHSFSKPTRSRIRLLAGLGVEGDAHMGVTVKHRSRVAADPTQPNLRQVHLIHAELFDEVAEAGFVVEPGRMGENITTRGVDLLALGRGTVLELGEARVEITGLRNPCAQIDDFSPGLLEQMVFRDGAGAVVRRAGVMGVVLTGGVVTPGTPVGVRPTAGGHVPLERV
ncbi:MOSC domain-containing protein [Nocardiopsis sp. MG754419]|uniref:MOSC domain-containing protein n=1 Tax=Nocardiopsis sp. MG754419 TaxID=2259865 RepID=UPI001BA986F6|nr:MOSC domain-containing protein [Nocardiopsis sp. MG754419]MBR8744763.1 MOSC domain-containing protein [Nocardiopsis sp. MG754419]